MKRVHATYCAALFLIVGISANAGIINGSFENPVVPVDGYVYDPAGAGVGWTFTGSSGVAAVGSSLFSNPAPGDNQAGFIDAFPTSSGSISQVLTGLTVGDLYDVSFFAAAVPGYGADDFTVSLGGTSLGTYGVTSTSWTMYTSATTVATSSTMTLAFTSPVVNPTLVYTNIDEVSLNDPVAPEPATFLLVAPLAAGLLLWRRRPNGVV